MLTRRRWLANLPALAAAARAGPGRASEQGHWPPATLRLLVAYPVGGVSSDIARLLAQSIERRFGTTVIVEHRPGAGGTLAMDTIARSAGDGRTLCFSAITPLTLAPLLGPVPYDPEHDIVPVFPVMTTPVLVLGTPALASSGFAEMLAEARAEPGRLRWATSGNGTTGHLVLERVAAASGAVFTHVPYKGGGQQLTDALGGQFELLSSNVAAPQLRLLRDRRLKALAVSGASRATQLPDIPTLAELGFPDANQVSIFGLFAPGQTPRDLRDAMHAALAVAADDPLLRRRLADTGNASVAADSPQAFADLVTRERAAHRAWLHQGTPPNR
ncbi:MAG: tripartite tricarboxylate transporter substrate binding protein [Piscinibacter sp.]|nr:tripartite tricarboxylate transporter substrate binding protein [Piscinibacter sp.]